MSDLAHALSAALGPAFEAAGLDPALGQVRRSDKPDLADFQCNGALAGAKQAKRNPREIAGEVVAAVADHPLIERIEAAGPGFLNIHVSASALEQRARTIAIDPKAGAVQVDNPERIVLDFGGANVAKPMHVGHLRTAVIGDTLQRVFRFLGETIISDVHLGDWGLQMGHLITELQEEQPDLPYFDASNEGPFPTDSPVSIEDLSRLYPQASAKAKSDEDRMARSQAAVAEMQAGRKG